MSDLHRTPASAKYFMFAYGACCIIAQLTCLDELLVIFSGYELSIGLALASWMVFAGSGSWWVRKIKSVSPALAILIFIPVWILTISAIRLSKSLFGFGMIPGIASMAGITFILLAPLGIVLGAIFSLAYAKYEKKGFSPAQAYLWDCLGTACGGIVYSFVLLGNIQTEWIIPIVSLVAAASAAAIEPAKKLRVAAIIILGFSFPLSGISNATRRIQWKGYELLLERQTRYGHIALAKTKGLVSIFENGIISDSFPNPPSHEELIHIPLLLHKDPKKVLLIGNGATGSFAEILKHPVEKVDSIEIDDNLTDIVKPLLTESDTKAIKDERVKAAFSDSRYWLNKSTNSYDLIILRLPDPSNAHINRLYTVEAFRAIKKNLSSSGMLAFEASSSENYLSPEMAYFNACLYKSLQKVFPNVEVVAGNPILFIAGAEPIQMNPQILTSRYLQRNLDNRLVVPSYIPFKLDKERTATLKQKLLGTQTSINSDLAPVCYSYALRIWIAKFKKPSNFLIFLGIIILFIFLCSQALKKRAQIQKNKNLLALGLLGASAMSTETALLLSYQSINGYVYWHLGGLFSSFMLGLALGSALLLCIPKDHSLNNSDLLFRNLLLGMAAQAILLAWLISKTSQISYELPWLLVFSAWLMLTGLWLGLAFPISGLSLPSETKHIAGSLYAADLWGSAIGAILSSAFIIPWLGIPLTFLIMGLAIILFTSVFFFKKIPNN